MGRIALVFLLVLGLGFVVNPSMAVADGPTAAERKKAKKLILKAGRAKRSGDKLAKRRGKRNKKKAASAYKKAAVAYLEALNLMEHAAVIFKLAEVYEARGENQWARRGYRRYLEMRPDGDNADDASARIEVLDKLIEEHAATGKPFPEDTNTELDPTAVFGLEKPAQPEEPEEPEEPAADETEASDDASDDAPITAAKSTGGGADKGKLFKWGGMGSAGVGVVFLSLGIVYGAKASSASSALSSNDDQWNINDRNRIESGEADASKMVLFTTLGAVTLVAGGALYYLGWRKDNQAGTAMAIVPAVGPDRAGIALSGSF